MVWARRGIASYTSPHSCAVSFLLFGTIPGCALFLVWGAVSTKSIPTTSVCVCVCVCVCLSVSCVSECLPLCTCFVCLSVCVWFGCLLLRVVVAVELKCVSGVCLLELLS